LRPDLVRDERFLAGFFDHGASDDGGREEFDESEPNRRSSSATRSAWIHRADTGRPFLIDCWDRWLGVA